MNEKHSSCYSIKRKPAYWSFGLFLLVLDGTSRALLGNIDVQADLTASPYHDSWALQSRNHSDESVSKKSAKVSKRRSRQKYLENQG